MVFALYIENPSTTMNDLWAKSSEESISTKKCGPRTSKIKGNKTKQKLYHNLWWRKYSWNKFIWDLKIFINLKPSFYYFVDLERSLCCFFNFFFLFLLSFFFLDSNNIQIIFCLNVSIFNIRFDSHGAHYCSYLYQVIVIDISLI